MDLIASSSTYTHVDPPEPNAMPPKKRVKKQGGEKNNVTQDLPQICHLTRVPLEIIAEILSYTTPRDILALTRCSKYLCCTLVKPSCEFIWKRARVFQCPIPTPIPEPTPNFTEPSYAAFIFDHGPCEVCRKPTKTMFASFTLRLRVCSDTCRKRWRAQKVVEVRPADVPRYQHIVHRIPHVEYRNFGYANRGAQDVLAEPSEIVFRKTQWLSAVDEYNKAKMDDELSQAYEIARPAAEQRQATIMDHGRQLVTWRSHYELQRVNVQTSNLQFAREFAEANQWSLFDLLQTPSFSLLYHTKNRSLEELNLEDVSTMRSSVVAEIAAILGKRRSRESENAYRKRREGVAEYYDSLKATRRDNEVLPVLSEFRKLPVVHVLQNKIADNTDKGILHDLKRNDLMPKLVQQAISHWQDTTKASFAAILGHRGWKKTNAKKLHPVDRLNARFMCKRCDARVHNRWFCKGMSYAEACSHQCVGLNKKERANNAWRPDQFRADEKGIDVANQLLGCCGVSADSITSLKVVQATSTRILCLSCPSQIVMDHKTMLSHCGRHEGMRIKLLTAAEAEAFMKRPLEHGLLAQVTAASPSSKTLREKKVYGCRHCEQACVTGIPTEIAGAPTAALSAAGHMLPGPTPTDSSQLVKEKTRGSQPKAGQEKPSKMFSFDGLRSHAKEKHGIPWIGDEDFYRESIDNTGTITAVDTT